MPLAYFHPRLAGPFLAILLACLQLFQGLVWVSISIICNGFPRGLEIKLLS